MTFGVTLEGFKLKRFENIREEIEGDLRIALGNAINLLPTELLGQIVGILTERESKLWELDEDVYNSQYPTTANGISLDNVAAITGIKRLAGNPSTVPAIAIGQEGTIIPQGSRVSVQGRPESVFQTDNQYVIGPGVDEVQEINFSALPDAGAFTLVFNGEETVSIAFNASNSFIQNALNSLNALSDVNVTGDFSSGLVITFALNNGATPQPLLVLGDNSLESSSSPVDITIAETTPGAFPNVAMDMTAISNGPTEARAGTLTIIETVIAGWDSVSNPQDAVLGRNVESDAELRLRRRRSLANPGAATVEAIRARLLQLDEVLACVVYQNITMVTDVFGRPPKSFEAVVLGAQDDDIADALWEVAPAGIEMFGSTTVPILDSQGFTQTIKFSRPTPIPIWTEIDLVTTPEFPIDGADAVIENVLAFARENFSIGDDVITVKLVCPIIDVQGVTDITLRIGTAPGPLTDDNIPIAPDEISDFDSSRILVNVS
ncbi:MAG TPA: hypothetical protein DF383_05030 [Deltaproteobacteria bacterium]|nr:hypothetical protein [Deltaproteobacteria bacterium]